MIQEAQAGDGRGLGRRLGRGQVLRAGLGVPGRVVVRQREAPAVPAEHGDDDLPQREQRLVGPAVGDPVGPEDA